MFHYESDSALCLHRSKLWCLSAYSEQLRIHQQCKWKSMGQEQEIVGFQMREGSNASHTSRKLTDEEQEVSRTPTPRGIRRKNKQHSQTSCRRSGCSAPIQSRKIFKNIPANEIDRTFLEIQFDLMDDGSSGVNECSVVIIILLGQINASSSSQEEAHRRATSEPLCSSSVCFLIEGKGSSSSTCWGNLCVWIIIFKLCSVRSSWMPPAERWLMAQHPPVASATTTGRPRRRRRRRRKVWLTELVQNTEKEWKWQKKEAYRRRLWDSTWQALICFIWIIPVYTPPLRADWGEYLMLEVFKLQLTPVRCCIKVSRRRWNINAQPAEARSSLRSEISGIIPPLILGDLVLPQSCPWCAFVICHV